MNSLNTFGEHHGGRPWTEEACQVLGGTPGEVCSRRSPAGQVLRIVMTSTFQEMVMFDAHYYHEVEPWSGSRYSVACWTNSSVTKLKASHSWISMSATTWASKWHDELLNSDGAV